MAAFSAADYRYMAQALRLAERGRYSTQPNPRVGCVLVRAGEVVGSGWHAYAGGGHAEVQALRAAGEQARGATAYVTLEPCSHHGRTPPCADALIDAGVARVVVAVEDPNPRVAGAGLARLQAAGVDTAVGVLSAEAAELNRGFFQRMRDGRPYVRLKLAASLDGRTAMASGESQWISSAASRADVHRLRAEAGAVVTGSGTVVADDPLLNVRDFDLPPQREQPLRVVLDSQLRTPPTARLLSAPGKTLLVHAAAPAARRTALLKAGAELLEVASVSGGVHLAQALAGLAEREVNDVLLECGAHLAGAFVQAGLVDELVLYLAPQLLGHAGRPLLFLPGLERLSERPELEVVDWRAIGADLRLRARFLK